MFTSARIHADPMRINAHIPRIENLPLRRNIVSEMTFTAQVSHIHKGDRAQSKEQAEK